MEVRCAECKHPIDLTAESSLSQIQCPSCGSCFSLISDETETFTGGKTRKIGRFELLEQVGKGAFGSVWKARDSELDRVVAIKIPRESQLDAEEAEQFLREARAAAQLNHPNIVSIHEVGREDRLVYLVSDFVRGATLDEHLSQPDWTPSEAATMCMKVADAIQHAHEAGVIHRDLKPSNIMVDARREPFVMDFGLAKREVGEITMTVDGRILGTPAFMSPEQARGEGHGADGRSDIFSLGIILYRMLTGELPFRGSRNMLLLQILHDDPAPPRRLNARVPRDLETICLKCLQKAPRQRYQTASELADDLRRWLAGVPIHARPAGIAARAVKWCRRRPAVFSLLAVSVVALTTVVGGVIWYNSRLQAALVRAEKERDRAQVAEAEVTDNLYQSLVGEARALRLARREGFRGQALRRLRTASDLKAKRHDVAELRREAIACLGDFVGFAPVTHSDFSEGIRNVALHPDGLQAAVVFNDGSVRIVDARSGQQVERLDAPAPLVDLWFSGDGKALIAESPQAREIIVWTDEGREGWQPRDPIPYAGRSAVASAGQLVAFLDSSSRVVIQDVVDGSAAGSVDVGRLPQTIGLSVDGRLLVTAHADRSQGTTHVSLWDVGSGERIAEAPSQLGIAYKLAISPNGKFVGGGYGNGMVLHEVPSLRPHFFVRGNTVETIAFSPDSQFVAFGTLGKLVRLWSVTGNREVAALQCVDPSPPLSIEFDARGSRLAAASSRSLRIWDLAAAKERLVLGGHEGGVSSVAFSSDGRLLASCGKDRAVKLWDAQTGGLEATLAGFEGDVQSAAFHKQRGLLVTGDWGATIRFWELHTFHEIARQKSPVGVVWKVALSSDGRLLAAAGGGGFAVWRFAEPPAAPMEDGIELELLVRRAGFRALDACFSPDGKMVAWVDGNVNIRVWSLAEEKEIAFVSPPLMKGIHALSFLPDSRHLVFVTAAGGIQGWNVLTGRRSLVLGEPDDFGKGAIALADSGRWLATQEPPDAVAIWNVAQGSRLLRLPGARTVVWSKAWSADGTKLAVGLADGGLSVWDIPGIRSALDSIGLDWTSELADESRPLIASAGKAPQPTAEDIFAWRKRAAQHLMKYGAWGTALEHLAVLRESNPEDGEVHLWCGMAYGSLEDNSGAVACYTKALELSPDTREALVRRALAYETLGQWREAAGDYERLVELAADDASAWHKLGVACARQRDWAKAASALRKSADLQPRDMQSWYYLALAQLAGGDQSGYRNTCQDLVSRHPQPPAPHIANAMAWMCVVGPQAVDDYATLVRWLDDAVAQSSAETRWAFQSTRNALLVRSGRLEEAAQSLADLPDIEDEGAKCADLLFWAICRLEMKMVPEARTLVEQAETLMKRVSSGELSSQVGSHWATQLEWEILRREINDGLESRPADD